MLKRGRVSGSEVSAVSCVLSYHCCDVCRAICAALCQQSSSYICRRVPLYLVLWYVTYIKDKGGVFTDGLLQIVRLMRIIRQWDLYNWCVHENYSRCVLIAVVCYTKIGIFSETANIYRKNTPFICIIHAYSRFMLHIYICYSAQIAIDARR